VGTIYLVGKYILVGKYVLVGMIEIYRMDEKGRVLVPKEIRDIAEMPTGSYFRFEAEKKQITIKVVEPVSEKYYGAFKVDHWPDDLDEFVKEEIMKQWMRKRT
jgi:bifunctional DNA-binding transcriptional regulator/antitoxin component of YhaV-PrlF toxin-antitoxin module